METSTEHHKIKRTLFNSIYKILRQHGLYSVEKEKIGYKLTYWIDNDTVYRVIKGTDEFDEDEEEDEFEYESDFVFNHMPYEVDCEEDAGNAEEINLDTGDILVFITEIENVVWFVCTTMLLDRQEMNSDWGLGFTEYGTLAKMLAEGLIEKVTIP